MIKFVASVACCLGLLGFAFALGLLLLAIGWWQLPVAWFSGNGTPPNVGLQVVAAVEQVILQWQLLLVAIGCFQLLHASALAVAGLRVLRLDPVGAAMLRFVARLGMLFELLKLGPYMLVLYQVWDVIHGFFPGKFPVLPGIDQAPSLSAAHAAALSLVLLVLVVAIVMLFVLKIALYCGTMIYLNRPATATRFVAADEPN